MERSVEEILAELRAKKAAAAEAEVQPSPAVPETPAEEPVPAPALPEEPVKEAPAPLPEPEPEPAPEPAPLPEKKEEPRPAKTPDKTVEKVAEKAKKGVDDLYVGSFGEKAYKADRLEKNRARKNRKALVVKESGRTGFFGGLFRLIGFLVVVALTILLVLIGLQFIADVEIIPVRAIVESIIAWLEDLLAKLGL